MASLMDELLVEQAYFDEFLKKRREARKRGGYLPHYLMSAKAFRAWLEGK